MMAAGLAFRLFGAVEVSGASGEPLDLGTRKQRALVAMLALEPGRVVSLDRLIDELWTGEPPAGATRTLQAYIAHLRKILEPDRPPRTPPRVLLTREPGYLLAVAPGQVDLGRFAAHAEEGRLALARGEHQEAITALDRAMALWTGDPLGEFADQEFARPTVARLTEIQTAALEDRFDARLALGEAASVIPGLQDLVEAHPYRERGWALLVLALYRTGRQADALAALRRVRARLSEDLGLTPGPELRALEQAVFDQAADLRPAAPTPEPPAPAPVPATSTLVGRSGQLAVLERRLAETRGGRGGVVLIAGEAGIGKSRLAQVAAELAQARGFRVAWGRCVEGTAPAFWPWTQIIRQSGHEGEPLSGEALEPTLYGRFEQTVAALTEDPRPLLVVLDDLHWADASSLRLLAYAADPFSRLPVLAVATLRPEPGDHPHELGDLLATLARQHVVDRLELTSFTLEEVAAYLRSRNLEEEPGTLLERTGGNPFYLGEVLRLSQSERRDPTAVPRGAGDVIDRRVARLPEETRELLRVGAIAGREFDVETLVAVTSKPAEEVMLALEPAVATGLLTEPPGGPDYRFGHALVRQALYAKLSRLERARLHLGVGRALEPYTAEAEAATLAHHFAQAAKVGGAAEAVRHAARAAGHAARQLAYTEAVQFWQLALTHLSPGDQATRARLLIGLAHARRATGEAEAAERDLLEAIELAGRLGDRTAMIDALSFFGTPALWHWRPYGQVDERIVAALEELLAGPLPDGDRARLLGTLGVELHYGPRQAEGERLTTQAIELTRRADDRTLQARTLSNYLLAAFVPGRNRERRAAAEQLAALPGLSPSTELVARVTRLACLLREADLDEWDRELGRCERLLDRDRRPDLEAMVRIAQTGRHMLDRDWNQVERLAAGYTSPRYGSSLWGGPYRRLVTAYSRARAHGESGTVLDDLLAAAEDRHLEPVRPLAILAAAESDRTDLAHDLIARWGTAIRQDWTADFLTPVWGLIAARLGSPEPRRLYETLLPSANLLVVLGIGSACWGSTHQVLAELADRMGRPETAREHTRAAQHALKDSGRRSEQAEVVAVPGENGPAPIPGFDIRPIT
ncbi:BTAD domain-containing putative transcriptional regulator [Nonomuraea sp. H19]|uniref:BTAD domain-containing putative transcriptional regulator n=1 Tax=Nonomuraea sp. H19 TaxID=3452206 RepID=UPI003F8CDCF9